MERPYSAINPILASPAEASWTCAALAREIGRHPNTLRKYETWGFIGPIPRSQNGYRRYRRVHALQALLAVTSLRSCFEDWRGRRRMKDLIAAAVASDVRTARSLLREQRGDIASRLFRAELAKRILAAWRRSGGEASAAAPSTATAPAAASGAADPSTATEPAAAHGEPTLSRKEAAAELGLAPDTLRDWERNRLVTPLRLENGRRRYRRADRERLAVVRVLRQAGYSHMGILNLFRGKTQVEDLTFARDRWDETLRGLEADCLLIEAVLDELESAGPTGPAEFAQTESKEHES